MHKSVALLITYISILISLTGCFSDEKQDAYVHSTPKVELSTAVGKKYEHFIELPARISPRRIAEVKARVPGILLSRNFKEGSNVIKGQKLFQIEPTQLEAVLAEAKAELAKSQASLKDKARTAKRYSALVKSKSVSQQQYDTAISDYNVALALKNAAAAKVKTAELNLSYSRVEAPISGRIGTAFVTEGALVGQNTATHLATIQQLSPIYADINEPVSDFLKQKQFLKTGSYESNVTVQIEEIGYKEKGRLLFSDVTVDKKTGQVKLRAEFPNIDNMLLPGMFVRIRVSLGVEKGAIFIPQRAVSITENGAAQIIVVDKNNTAQARKVETGIMKNGTWQILSGLKIGEKYVSLGSDKIHAGQKISTL